jgi:hypothetical protein
VTAAAEITLFIHVHDAIHYPGHSPFQKCAWFRFLDRHHYVHHVDLRANTNFLLPLGDLLFGTLRRELTPDEIRPLALVRAGACAPGSPSLHGHGRAGASSACASSRLTKPPLWEAPPAAESRERGAPRFSWPAKGSCCG